MTPDLLEKARPAVLRESDHFQFADLPLDQPIPASHLPTDADLAASAGRRSRAQIYLNQAVADELERWFLAGAADGFMIGYGSGIAQFADRVMPLLAERGLWKPATDHDLRSRLGLPERG